MMRWIDDWRVWALLSALFAALTAIFGKVGVQRIDSDFATLIRVVVILAFLAVLVVVTGQGQPLSTISAKTYTFLTLSALATGASWLCYFRALKLGPASKVAPLDKLSVVFVLVLSTLFLHESVGWKTVVGVVTDTKDEAIGQLTASPRFNTALLSTFAAVAFLMAIVGVYGVLAFSVTERSAEIGIRMALGATPRAVLALVMKEGAVVVAQIHSFLSNVPLEKAV